MVFPRMAPTGDLPLPTGLDGVTLNRLATIFQEVLSRQPEEEPEGIVVRRTVTVEQKIEELSDSLQRQKRLSFRSFISACSSRVEVIVCFLAVLEMIKAVRLVAEQGELFGDISLVRQEPNSDS